MISQGVLLALKGCGIKDRGEGMYAVVPVKVWGIGEATLRRPSVSQPQLNPTHDDIHSLDGLIFFHASFHRSS